MTEQGPLNAGIEDARVFAARPEVSDLYELRSAVLEDLAPVLALFARAQARQAADKSLKNQSV